MLRLNSRGCNGLKVPCSIKNIKNYDSSECYSLFSQTEVCRSGTECGNYPALAAWQAYGHGRSVDISRLNQEPILLLAAGDCYAAGADVRSIDCFAGANTIRAAPMTPNIATAINRPLRSLAM